MLSNASLICEIIVLYQVRFIHFQHGSADEIVAKASAQCDFSTVLRTGECFDDIERLATDGNVLLIADALSDFVYKALQQTCYPAAGVWCLIQDGFESKSANLSICDVFLLAQVSPTVEHVINRKRGLTIFTWTPTENVCNKAGIFLSHINDFKSDFNGLRLRRMDDYLPTTVYEGKPVAAREISPLQHGIVQGFEFSLVSDVRQHLNFTIINVSYGNGTSDYGQEPEPDTYWGNSIIGYILRREVHFCYGDLSVLFPRSLFIDFTYTHDVDVAVFLAKVDVKLFTGGHLLELVRGPVSACYMICVIFLSFWLSIDRLGAPKAGVELWLWSWRLFFKLVETLTALASYVVHPANNVRLLTDFRGTSAFLIGLWKVCMLWLVIVFSGELISIVAKPNVVGDCDTIAQITRVLRTVPRARIYTWRGFKTIFHESAVLDRNRDIEVIMPYMEAHRSDSDVVDPWRNSRVSFLFGESILLRRSVWKYNMGDFTYQSAEHTYNAYQAIGFQRGCVLQPIMNIVVQQLVETGHLRHYKRKAGLHLDNQIRVPYAERAITLYSMTTSFLVIGVSYGLCIVALLAEIFLAYEMNRPVIPMQYYTLRISLDNATESNSRHVRVPVEFVGSKASIVVLRGRSACGSLGNDSLS